MIVSPSGQGNDIRGEPLRAAGLDRVPPPIIYFSNLSHNVVSRAINE
jgi:hypothetical protein